MSCYSQGVLIHNFNEDRYGRDLQHSPPPVEQPKISVSHTVHHWKVPDPAPKIEPAAAQHVDRHLFFGHSGDMRDPRVNLQKTEFATAHQYFMQDPKTVPHIGHVTADAFMMSDDPKKIVISSHLAASKKKGWGDMRQSHALPPNERFLTTSKLHYQGLPLTETVHRMPRHYGEFTTLGDRVNLTRSTATLRSTGKLAISR
eukprot:SRR837773.2171.p1 GENE.SRR837773.2171~~SRR837773.2171.p1  ORF type:complete len:226 (+),score=36.09 SRR837773.2171:76-678(+)